MKPSQRKAALSLLRALFLLCIILCSAQPAAAKVRLSQTTMILKKGSSATLKVTGSKAKVNWSTSKKSVATVSSKGKVKGKKAGTATITAKVGKKKLKCSVTVKNKLTGTWETREDGQYYLLESGKYAAYWQEIDGSIYIFDLDGRLVTPEENSLVTIGKYRYYVTPKGNPIPGWHVITETAADGTEVKNLYYMGTSGKVSTGTTVEGIRLSDTGEAEDSDLARYQTVVSTVVDGLTTPEMTKAEKLKACWNYLTSKKNFSYLTRYPDLNDPHWYQETAADMLRNKRGNCYSFACAFAAMANDIGYSSWVVCGRVSGSRDRSKLGVTDGLTRHSWVWISSRHYDPEGCYAGFYKSAYGVSRYAIRHTIQTYTRYKDGKVLKNS